MNKTHRPRQRHCQGRELEMVRQSKWHTIASKPSPKNQARGALCARAPPNQKEERPQRVTAEARGDAVS
jgi:hypothetical protein